MPSRESSLEPAPEGQCPAVCGQRGSLCLWSWWGAWQWGEWAGTSAEVRVGKAVLGASRWALLGVWVATAGRDGEDLDLCMDMVRGLTLPLFSLPPHLVPSWVPAREEDSPETWPCLVRGWCRSPGHVLKTPPTHCLP